MARFRSRPPTMKGASLSLVLFQLSNLRQLQNDKNRHSSEAYPIVRICSAFGFIFQEIDDTERQHHNQCTVENNSVSFY